MQLDCYDGSATLQSSFTRIIGNDSTTMRVSFKAPKKKDFVVLLLGTIDKGDVANVDIDKMLNNLGYYKKG